MCHLVCRNSLVNLLADCFTHLGPEASVKTLSFCLWHNQSLTFIEKDESGSHGLLALFTVYRSKNTKITKPHRIFPVVLEVLKVRTEKKVLCFPTCLPPTGALLSRLIWVFFFPCWGHFSVAFYDFPLRQVTWVNYIRFHASTFLNTDKLFSKFYIWYTKDHSSSTTLFFSTCF